MICPHENMIRRHCFLICTSCFEQVEQIIGQDVEAMYLFGDESQWNMRREIKCPVTRVLDRSKKILAQREKGGWGRKRDRKELLKDLETFCLKFFKDGKKRKFPKKVMVLELLAKRRGFPFRFNFKETTANMDEVARMINETKFETEGVKLSEKGKCPIEKVMRTSERVFLKRVKKGWGDQKDSKILKKDFYSFCEKLFQVYGEEAKFPRKSFVMEKLARKRKLKCSPEKIRLELKTRLLVSEFISKCSFDR